jgi:hypothetical protein
MKDLKKITPVKLAWEKLTLKRIASDKLAYEMLIWEKSWLVKLTLAIFKRVIANEDTFEMPSFLRLVSFIYLICSSNFESSIITKSIFLNCLSCFSLESKNYYKMAFSLYKIFMVILKSIRSWMNMLSSL